jgi:hypothetical protein
LEQGSFALQGSKHWTSTQVPVPPEGKAQVATLLRGKAQAVPVALHLSLVQRLRSSQIPRATGPLAVGHVFKMPAPSQAGKVLKVVPVASQSLGLPMMQVLLFGMQLLHVVRPAVHPFGQGSLRGVLFTQDTSALF